jgi:hypothetical protein
MPMLSLKFHMEPRRAQSDAVDAMFGALCDLYNAAQQRIEACQRRRMSLRCGNRSITAFFGGAKKAPTFAGMKGVCAIRPGPRAAAGCMQPRATPR